MIFDPMGRCLWASPGAVDILGLTAVEATGNAWKEWPEQGIIRRILHGGWSEVLARDATVRQFLVQPNPDGQRHYESVLSPAPHGSEGLRAVILTLRDITQLKSLEESLRQAEEQLRHVQKIAALGSLAGGIAHDFNNLMTVVVGYCDLLLRVLPPEAEPPADEMDSARSLTSEIHKAGRKAALLTQQMLAFTRKQAALPCSLDLNQVVGDMEKLLRRSLPTSVRLHAELSGTLSPVLGDAGQIGQVLMNLVLNARDAMPQGGDIRIRTCDASLVGCEPGLILSPGAGDYCALSVADNGMGIGPEIRARLFEPFFSTKDSGKGTGLGLSTVFNILKEAGGGIALESLPRRGSTFTVYLPRADQAAVAAPTVSQAPAASPSGTATILLVEDEEPVRRLLASVLTAEGYRVLEAEGGSQALRIAVPAGNAGHGADRIDLVITDLIMPGMGGRALMETLQALRPGLRAIYMSGYFDDEAFLEGLAEHDVPFLAKPFAPLELSALVRKTLEGKENPAGRTPGSQTRRPT